MGNLVDIAKVVIESNDLSDTQKMSLLHSIVSSNSIENNNQSAENNGTFKVTVKKQTSNDGDDKTSFGHLKWKDDIRVEMFKICLDTFGHHDHWVGKTVPGGSINFNDACEQIANHFGRTKSSIKSQIRDVIMPIAGSRELQRDTLERIKKLALEAGFISKETAYQ